MGGWVSEFERITEKLRLALIVRDNLDDIQPCLSQAGLNVNSPRSGLNIR